MAEASLSDVSAASPLSWSAESALLLTYAVVFDGDLDFVTWITNFPVSPSRAEEESAHR